VSKPKKTAADFIPRDWVPLKVALLRLISITGSRERGLSSLNRGLRSGRLRSLNVQSSPDGSELATRHDPSYWEQHAVGAPQNPEEGVWVEPYEAGNFYVRAVDLDKFAGTPTMAAAPQSDEIGSPKRRRGQAVPKRPKRRQTSLQEILGIILDREYPNGVPESTATSAVRQKVAAAWKEECKAHKRKLSEAPSPDTIDRRLGRRRD
jgi:hypothetical protein